MPGAIIGEFGFVGQKQSGAPVIVEGAPPGRGMVCGPLGQRSGAGTPIPIAREYGYGAKLPDWLSFTT
jgi:hypothetical protein